MPKTSLTLLFAIILGLAVAFRLSTQENQILPKNQKVKLVATLKKEPKILDRSQVLEIGDGKFYVDFYPQYRAGDKLLIEGQIDGEGRVYNPKIEIVGKSSGFSSYLANLRSKIAKNMAALLPSREATLVSGTVLGVDTIEKGFREELIKTGTIHVVVVSGQNLMIVAGIFLSLAKYLGRKQSLVAATVAVFAYAFLTGFEPPVVRASLMVLASSLAIYVGRETLPIWSLIIAALLIIFIWPESIFEVSFQLTFAATLGIMTLGQFFRRVAQGPVSRFPPASAPQPFLTSSSSLRVSKSQKGGVRAVGSPSSPVTLRNYLVLLLKDVFWGNAAIATSAYIFTVPIILFHFGRISLLSPFANILVLEAVFPIMLLGFLMAFVGLIFLPFAQLLAYFAYVPAFYFVKVVEIFANLPVEQVAFGKGSLVVVIAFYILLTVLIWVWHGHEK